MAEVFFFFEQWLISHPTKWNVTDIQTNKKMITLILITEYTVPTAKGKY